MVMQIYADILSREMKLSRSAQTCALGSAIAAAVVAGNAGGSYDDFDSAQAAMTGVKDLVYKPIPKNQAVYAKLYKLYKQLHDSFGLAGNNIGMANIMKDLLDIKESCQN
jgi:L-ribulokinase